MELQIELFIYIWHHKFNYFFLLLEQLYRLSYVQVLYCLVLNMPPKNSKQSSGPCLLYLLFLVTPHHWRNGCRTLSLRTMVVPPHNRSFHWRVLWQAFSTYFAFSFFRVMQGKLRLNFTMSGEEGRFHGLVIHIRMACPFSSCFVSTRLLMIDESRNMS